MCEPTVKATFPLPSVESQHLTLDYWLGRNGAYGDLDQELMSSSEVALHNEAIETPFDGERLGQRPLAEDVSAARILEQVNGRLSYVRERVESGEYVLNSGGAPGRHVREALQKVHVLPAPTDTWHRTTKLAAIHCVPVREGLFAVPVDADFDRNVCSTAREGESMRVVAVWPNGLRLVRAGYTMGWMDGGALSEPLAADDVRSVAKKPSSFTRRALLAAAFAYLDKPYGWGGRAGGYDCSRFLLDLFGEFGLRLPRHSAAQAQAGTFSIDVSSVDNQQEKLLIIEAAARRGVVLLQFPGHIMLYLGRTETGAPMAIHAFSEYLTLCEKAPAEEVVNRVDRVTVSDLSLGAGTSRRDFLSRTTTVTVVGQAPDEALTADAVLRPSLPPEVPGDGCTDSLGLRIFRSPHRPHRGQPLRVIAVSQEPLGTATLQLFGPDGAPALTTVHALDGPPGTLWTEVASPADGAWRAIVGEGTHVRACKAFSVANRPPRPLTREEPGPAWTPRWRWEHDTENFFSAFVEQLFLEPTDGDVTWPKLQALIADPARNLLYDHRAPGEDARLDLEPDCADLPYFLRAYFAWKLRLPFAFRDCSRGKAGRPPRCLETTESNLFEVDAKDNVDAFRKFTRKLASTVHSASARTVPDDSLTDFYPVEVSRKNLPPGTVFADPYGHLLVVARWKPQGIKGYGVLVGADAQPDGTVGRRRFWRGSFLFHPDTKSVGAGFKAWRPVRYLYNEKRVVDTPNEGLRRPRNAPRLSYSQYKGSTDDFYASVEGLINPRPLDPVRLQRSLVDALEESVARRVNSVDNGEAFMKERGYAPIDMPERAAIFQTTGPWEDYSTPSRDMRLLISIDAVVDFPDQVAAAPERFGLADGDGEAGAARVRAVLDEELGKRSFSYTRSDGTAWTLTLRDLIDRVKALEVAYNPNDCAELRWGAADGTDEYAPCKRHAPAAQLKRMARYRDWFATRKRPVH